MLHMIQTLRGLAVSVISLLASREGTLRSLLFATGHVVFITDAPWRALITLYFICAFL